MSLKAKLEAVIYAAEEPVTLAQLAMLFANEALEWKAEQQAAARAAEEARSAEASAGEPAELPLPLAEPPAEPTAVEAELSAAAAGTEQETAAGIRPEGEDAETSPESVEGAPDIVEQGMESSPQAEQDSAAVEAEARRAARQREREVRAILREVLDQIVASYAADGRGVEIREIAGGYRMGTKPECHDAVRMFVKSLKPPLKLSLPALETLAVIAYKQPVTAPEVNEIRGVDSSGVFGSLLARKLIATAGRKQVIGRPILYKTTKEFLLRFGLKDIAELPSMEEFEKMAAGELEEIGSAEPIVGNASTPAAALEFDQAAGEAVDPAAGNDADSPALPPQAAAESPQSESESNPSEAAPPHPQPSAE